MKLKLLLLSLLLSVVNSYYGVAQPAYNFNKLLREDIGRGLVAIRQDESTVAISWRYLSSDPTNTAFNIYRNGTLLNRKPIDISTIYYDQYSDKKRATYQVRTVVKGKETNHKNGTYTLPENAPIGYIEIPVLKGEDGTTPSGELYTYTPSDATIADIDGDGEYEIIIKQEPSNQRDNAQDGYTGNVLIDCYRLNGEFVWRIDLGQNIRAGAHYTQFMVYDLNGDGKAEVVIKTADGTIDGKGNVIGDPDADNREKGRWVTAKQHKNEALPREPEFKYQGRILTGKEYLTLFSAETGEALYTTDYIPQRGDVNAWGDERANRSDRFLACIAYLDGVKPSVVMCRGYYTRSVLAAFDWDGKELVQRWVFDSDHIGNENYAGQGNHNLRVADVDADGCDEIIYGSCTIDHNGKGLYSTGMGHGDALQLTQFDPSNTSLQVWACHENKRDGSTFRSAATGEIIFQIKESADVGRCMAADIDPTNYGVEMWSTHSEGIRNIKGEVIAPRHRNVSINMALWWDGDLLRELLNKNIVAKYDWTKKHCVTLMQFDGAQSINGTKATPCLQGDIIGDWREEVLLVSDDRRSLRLYVSTIPTKYRFHTFLEDPIYRISIATQNVAYNQPTQPGFYLGADMPKGWFRGYLFK